MKAPKICRSAPVVDHVDGTDSRKTNASRVTQKRKRKHEKYDLSKPIPKKKTNKGSGVGKNQTTLHSAWGRLADKEGTEDEEGGKEEEEGKGIANDDDQSIIIVDSDDQEEGEEEEEKEEEEEEEGIQ